MATSYDWAGFAARLQMVIPAGKVEEFAIIHGLGGIRLDRIRNGKKGVTVDTLVRI